MDHAWLDSLSEDWVSHPAIDTPADKLSPLANAEFAADRPRREPHSRIPRPAANSKSFLSSVRTSSPSVLFERSASDANVSSRRPPSGLGRGIGPAAKDMAGHSLLSLSGGSFIRNVTHRGSASRGQSDTPEWKRRLVHGKVPYGEQRDLFSSIAVGLQDIFKRSASGQHGIELSRSTMPSSPPINSRLQIDADLECYVASEDDDELNVHAAATPSPSPIRRSDDVRCMANVRTSLESSREWRQAAASQPPMGAKDGRRAVQDDRTGTSRTISAQSDTRNEALSPILIGKQSDQDGHIDFTPIDVPVEQLQLKLERLQMNRMLSGAKANLQARFAADDEEILNLRTSDKSMLNEDFTNVQRGSELDNGSFYNRRLSSDMGVDPSEMLLPEESLQASTPKQFPTRRTQASERRPGLHFSISPSLPRAPFPSPEKRQIRRDGHDPETVPTGSPLKLFGPYDTFTNQTLLRRISQFEEGSRSPSRASLNVSDLPARQPHQDAMTGATVQHRRTVSRFGGGDLAGFEFNGDLSFETAGNSEMPDEDLDAAPTSAECVLPPPSSLQQSPDDGLGLVVNRSRNKSISPRSDPTSTEKLNHPHKNSLALENTAPATVLTPRRNYDSEGKRPRTSPSKDSTPKRRRTLHRSDVAFGREQYLTAVGSAHLQMQAAIKHRNSSGLVTRSISHRRGASSSSSLLNLAKRSLSVLRMAEDKVNVPSDDSRSEQQQPSIRTQDFVHQAAQIMAMIRSQVRPGLTSVEESEAEHVGESPSLRSSHQESTNEPFSRPPSREVKPLPRIPPHLEDPELIKRLQQYQERSDVGDFISLSLQSTRPSGRESLTAHPIQKRGGESTHVANDRPIHVYGSIITDLPNVQITPNQAHSSRHGDLQRDFLTNSSGRSTSRNFATTSSRGSESRRTIMPESVLHLIPDRVGSMYLDKQKNIWVRSKDTKPLPRTHTPPSDDSEDDPFASIPDLTVDMAKELQNLRLAASQGQAPPMSGIQHWSRSSQTTGMGSEGKEYDNVSPQEWPSQQMTWTAKERFDRHGARTLGSSTNSNENATQGQDPPSTMVNNWHAVAPRRRNVTITFSSPLTSAIDKAAAEDTNNPQEDDADTSTTTATRPTRQHDPRPFARSFTQGTGQPASAHESNFLPRQVSRIDEQDEDSTVEIQINNDRQVSIVGENSMLNNRRTPSGRHASVSFIINHTPIEPDESAIIGHNLGRLSLSPLSEFTLNRKSDQSFGFEVSYVMGRRHMVTGDGSKKVMSMTIRELVDKLGEAEPYEPFWEDMTELALEDKQLTSLHMLSEFCGCIVSLNASGNKLGHLDGIPSTVRHLNVARNMLTELTSWNHLMNLQYVDISNNEVTSLSALKNLVHLRSIRADNIQLTSLDGFEYHDGLLALRARNNAIEKLDFSTVTLERLTELDLEGNRISSIESLDLLPSLSRLKLRGNKLRHLRANGDMRTLLQLDLGDNEVTHLDLSQMPSVRSVHADRNRIHQVSGSERARRLDSLSLREQRGNVPLNLDFLSRAYEIRKLFLSGNYLGKFEPAVDFLNLQLLEIANCGLQRLPGRLGQKMPNLRTLNINFNAIGNLSPLQFIPRLKKLLAAGNRLTDSTAVTQLVMGFPHITQVDIRDNPITLGLYAPLQALMPMGQSRSINPFTLPDADAERDGLYASRLDETTRLRRRLHQLVLVGSCRRLRKLDGLSIERREVLIRDSLLEALVVEGLLAESQETLVAPKTDEKRRAETDGRK